MNIKQNCFVLSFAILSAASAAEDVNVKVKVGVDDGEPERQELKSKIVQLVSINEQLQASVAALELRPRIESGNDITIACEDPTDVFTRNDVYKGNELPGEDDLDAFMTNKTGCKYTPLKVRDAFDVKKATFDGVNPFMSVFAVRGLEHAHVNIWWNYFESSDYFITIADYGYEAKVLSPNGARTLLRKQVHGALSGDHYEKFYIIVDGEYLVFGRLCEENPIFKQKISIAKGNEISLRFRSDSYYGAKFLYECPDNDVNVQHGIFGKIGEYLGKKVLKEVFKKVVGKDIEDVAKDLVKKGIDALGIHVGTLAKQARF